MKFKILHNTDRQPHERLVLLFAGWGMSERPFQDLTMPGYDVAVVWDYRDMSAPWTGEITGYGEIALVAWSFGVHAAARFMASQPGLPVTARIAVNGTRFTSDDTRGIPQSIFQGTLSSLNERNLTKFHMRMCGGGAAYRAFANAAPQRDVRELREELQAFDTSPAQELLWDKAFISRGDLIIPPSNQHAAWSGEAVETIDVDGAHMPDFNILLRRCLTDKTYVAERFHKAENTYDTNATPQLSHVTRLIDIASHIIDRDIRCMLEIGCGTGRSASLAIDRFFPAQAMLWDLNISGNIEKLASAHQGNTSISWKSCDAETEIRNVADSSVDLLLSASTVQWFNSLPEFLRQTARVLAPGGYAVISTYGDRTMHEIHSSAGSECRFPTIGTVRKAIPQSLETEHLSEELVTVSYPSPIDVLRHVSLTGVNGIETEGSKTAKACRMLRGYPTAADGSAPLTYHPIYMILKKS
ncbi:MAG: DUF452 family protein [Muribaculaceae bacterium]|nr:DUF452 family protein [Muribaculaceae bacterium]